MNLVRAVVVIVLVLLSYTSAVEITGFQPAIVPIRSVTTLSVATAGQLNPNSTIQCRFNDISMPAEVKGSMLFCNTPPMRQIDKAVLHLEVDGKLFKAKKQLRLHEPFKVTGISPKIASPSEQLAIKVSGITCEKWMTFFVRFQTANGTKRTRKGICNNSTVTCYIPEFPAHALLRVGVTLSNRIVEWSPTKLRIQYPVDSIKSSLKDLQPNIKRSGAFTFKVALKDKFQNPVSDPGNPGSDIPLSVQYSPSTHPKELHFLPCEMSLTTDKVGSEYGVSCHGAKQERILIYPSINNVPVGGTASYEVKTTLCPGKTSCDDNSTLIIIVSSSLGIVLVVILGALIYKYRYTFHRIFVPSEGSHPDDTSMELNECQGNQMLMPSSIENVPETHANESGISSDKEPSHHTENTIYEFLNLTYHLENEPEHLKKEKVKVNEEAEELLMHSEENVPGAHVNVALSTHNSEVTNEAKSESESSKATEHHPISKPEEDVINFENQVFSAKDMLLVEDDGVENLELQKMKMLTTELELEEKF